MKHVPITFPAATSVANTTEEIREKLHNALRILDDVSTLPQQGIPSPSATVTEQDVRALLQARRSRAHFFDHDLFADPAWDMLLELYAAQLGQRRITVSSLCTAAAVPATTALRWIGVLEKRGLLARVKDAFDGRRVFISLAEKASDAMTAYFATCADQQQDS